MNDEKSHHTKIDMETHRKRESERLCINKPKSEIKLKRWNDVIRKIKCIQIYSNSNIISRKANNSISETSEGTRSKKMWWKGRWNGAGGTI